jgi:hypothetical protein
MRHALRLHPDSCCEALTRIEVEIVRPRAGGLRLTYIATGRIGELRLPLATAPGRGDELWRHTCCEAFLRLEPGEAYYELNFAPSTQWAAYRLNSYRTGTEVAAEIAALRIEAQSSAAQYTMQATFDLPGLASEAGWRLGLSAVIEEANGRKSYWALAHPAGNPDFHHSDCFALELPKACRA